MPEQPGTCQQMLELRTEELLLSEENLRTIIRHNADGILILGLDGCVLFANPSACTLVGRTEKDLDHFPLGLPLAETGVCEINIRRPDGTMRIAEMRSVSMSWEQHPAQLASLRDITERKALEEQLQQAQRLESVGRLAGGVAHDFNNLMTVIIGAGQLLIEREGTNSPQRDLTLEIMRAAERASNLTRQLLAFSRRQILHPERLDVCAVVQRLKKTAPHLIGDQIPLNIRTADTPLLIQADPEQIEQALLDLLANARDAMPSGGIIGIEVSATSVSGSAAVKLPPGEYVTITVSDTGLGMDETTMQRIFEPFFTTKPFGKGRGLGLSTVYGIVKQSGGTIHVSSEPNHGSTFRIDLPRVAAPAQERPVPEATGPYTILIVEDEVGIRKLVRMMLQQAGYEVLEASDGNEALDRLQHHEGPVHLLLTDVSMPGMNGRELSERVGELRPGLPVLLVSGHIDDEAIQSAGSPRLSVLQKPFTRDQLATKVRSILAPRPAAKQAAAPRD